MKVRLIAVGTRMPQWVTAGYEEYARRLGPDLPLELIEIDAGKRTRNADVKRLTELEGEAMLKAVGANTRIVALDVGGKSHATEQLSQQLARWQHDGRDLALLVGGPEGLAPACLERAEQRWSLSALTLPHPLVRIMVAEQLYRCWTLWHGHPYHR